MPVSRIFLTTLMTRAALCACLGFALPVTASATFATLQSDGSCVVPVGEPEYRTYDGTCNNIEIGKGEWGSVESELLRPHMNEVAAYEEDGSTPLANGLRSPREISNAVVAQGGDNLVFSELNASDMLMQWGQFLDHDLDLTHVDKSDVMPIQMPAGDMYFSGEMPFSRSVHNQGDDGDGNPDTNLPRQQLNATTAYIDASQIYGSDEMTANSLRTFSGGKLKMTDAMGGLLHMEGTEFVSGDERAMEQVGLTAMHTLFNREHNRIAEELAAANPSWDDEQLYQEARKIVGAIMQVITYNEFLPTLLGSGAPGAYTGYNPDTNAGIANVFSTAAYRFGHSTLSPELQRLDADGNVIANGNLPLQDAFFDSSLLLNPDNGGIEAVLRGLVTQVGQKIDPMIVDALRNMLFGPPGSGGMDLASLNIQRGRDHGLPGFNAMRDALGLGAYADWDEAEFQPGFKALLMGVYDDVDDIDLWVGGLAEQHVNGGMLGELFSAILLDQFTRIREGDRFWYELTGMFEPEWLAYIEGSTLANVILRNTGIDTMRANVFVVPAPTVLMLLLVGGLGLRLRRG
ncbi:MAG: peroxidase family protein [Gammaproteobacteria bacterium]|nr:peroxidase family protein [Gammaproteobacteria bacterium]